MSNIGMEIFETRRARLIKLIEDDFEGNQASFCRHTEIGAPQLNRWISETNSDKRNITERSAREIERKCGKPMDWLDRQDDYISLSDEEANLISIYRRLSRYDKDVIALQAQTLLDRPKLEISSSESGSQT